MDRNLPVPSNTLDALLLRAQGLYQQAQAQTIKWQWAAITVAAIFSFFFLVWLYAVERRNDIRQERMMDLKHSVIDLTSSIGVTQEIIQELVARDVQRDQQMRELKELLGRQTTSGKTM